MATNVEPENDNSSQVPTIVLFISHVLHTVPVISSVYIIMSNLGFNKTEILKLVMSK